MAKAKDPSSMKRKLCGQWQESGGDDMACPHFAKAGWCSFAHGEWELNGGASGSGGKGGGYAAKGGGFGGKAAFAPKGGKQAFGGKDAWGGGKDQGWGKAGFNNGGGKAGPYHDVYGKGKGWGAQAGKGFQEPPAMPGVSAKIVQQNLKKRLCKSWQEAGGDDGACPHFAKHGFCAYAHGEHELGNAGDTYPAEAQQPVVSEKLNQRKLKSRLCKDWVEGGRDNAACSHFTTKGWCAYAHGEEELDSMPVAAVGVAGGAYPIIPGVMMGEAPGQMSQKLDQRRLKTRLCKDFMESDGDDQACPFFAKKGFCAYAHGEHELDEAGAAAPPTHAEPQMQMSQKLNQRRMKTKMCGQFVEAGGDDGACPHFAKNGWCAYAHGEHEMSEAAEAAPAQHDPMTQMSSKLNQRRMKTKLCGQFMDAGCDDMACPHFAKAGWCAYAHGAHELDDAAAAPQHMQMQQAAAPFSEQGPSPKLNQQRMKTRLCKVYVENGYDDASCPHFAKAGWCAYAHGEHELSA